MERRELAHWVVSRSQERGASQTEAFLLDHKSFSVQVRHGGVETISQAQEKGLGLRVIVGNQMGFAYSSRLDKETLEDAIGQAIANAAKTGADQYINLPEPGFPAEGLRLYDPTIEETPVEEKITMAKTIEDAAFAYDRRVVRSEHAAYEDTVYEVSIVSSKGLDVDYRGSFCGGYVWVVAEENGDTQTGAGMEYLLDLKDLDPEAIGREAGEQAVSMLGARKVSSQKVPVVMPPRVATQFLGVLAPALSAEAVQKGRSLLAGKLGEKIASSVVNLVDDGNLAKGINSSPVDGEGVPTGRTVLVKEGQLETYLHNTYSAARAGSRSTGNASRSSYRGTPEIGPSNLFMEPGESTREEILGDIKQGFFVTEVLGMHTANPISGDFSVGAAGLWIEKGELAFPVRGVAIADNILELFRGVEAVGRDLRFYLGYGAPTIRLQPMTVSGE